jgi:hypothetical protein
MARMKDLDIWLKQCGWEFKDCWWRNPRFPGKKFDWQQAVSMQRIFNKLQAAPIPRVIPSDKPKRSRKALKGLKEIPYWKMKRKSNGRGKRS